VVKSQDLNVVGRSLLRVDGEVKVTGRAIYAADLELPGMIYAKVLRSPFAHAKLVSIDARKAERLPGVFTVLTRDTIGEFKHFGSAYKDQTIVATEKVRYVGDPVAAVAAENDAIAEEALSLIEAQYEEIPVVTTIEEALAPSCPLVHELKPAEGNLYAHHFELPEQFKRTNICFHYEYRKGKTGEAFDQADHILEDTFTFPQVQHYSMEPHVTVANVEGERITVWAATQDPFTLREHLASIFSLPRSMVRVIVPFVGGAFGGKLSVKTEPITVALSWKARRPVKLVQSAEESFKTITRHPARIVLKSGVTRDGQLIGRECEIYLNTGAYADAGPRVAQKAAYRSIGPYRIPNIKIVAYAVYTNTVPAGAFRGFGSVQVAWAYECHTDTVAKKLGMDPLDFRLKNLLKKGEPYTPGDTPVDCNLREGLVRVAKTLAWGRKKSNAHTGKGLSCCIKDAGGSYKIASAAVKLAADGSVLLLSGAVDFGQGALTALTQVLAEELDISPKQIAVAQLDTDVTPYDVATSASRSTTVMGLCVQRAARDVKKKLLRAASRALGEKAARLKMGKGKIYNSAGQALSYEDVVSRNFGSKWGEVVGFGSYQDKKDKRAALGARTVFWEVSWGGAEVEVDPETGTLKLRKYISATDVGKAINPLHCAAQDEGGVMFGIGHTVFEEMIYTNGQLANPSLIDYRIARFGDLPDKLHTELIENGNGPGPYGSKGMGEGGILPVAPAITNAVADAIGVRMFSLPLTPERVWRAIKTSQSTKSQ
jgi:CO/xanthine dehydrogenase Mo-binding subunit